MAATTTSISTPRLQFPNSNLNRFLSRPPTRLLSYHGVAGGPHHLAGVRRLAGARFSDSALRPCHVSAGSGVPEPGDSGDVDASRSGWDSLLRSAVRAAVRLISELAGPPRGEVKGLDRKVEEVKEVVMVEDKKKKNKEEVVVVVKKREEEEEEEWSWERWSRHFEMIEESERLIADLKLQQKDAVNREDLKCAQKLKLEIAAEMENDAVGRAIFKLNRAIEEERYSDATYLRDHAGAGLLGWWSGISGDGSDPYGVIVCISAEHGRYVARSYNFRQLISGSPGFPLFEVYFTERDGGEYRQQAVYLKPRSNDLSHRKPVISSINISGSSLGGKLETRLDDENDDDTEIAAFLAGLLDLTKDMIPGSEVKVFKVVSPEKVDTDYLYSILDQISEEVSEDDDAAAIKDTSTEDIEDENSHEETEAGSAEEENDTSDDDPTAVSFGSVKEFASQPSLKTSLRMPARLEKRDRLSFAFYTEQDAKKKETGNIRKASKRKVDLRAIQHAVDLSLPDLAKLAGKNKKISVKVVKLDRNQRNKRFHQMSPVTHFCRITMPTASDQLSGLYANLSEFGSEIVSLQRKFGQWQEDDSSQEPMNLTFYEYVEAVKLTGDNRLPVGQVLFRARVGKHNRLPMTNAYADLPVVARYRGQGRLADNKNSRWVDGELLILKSEHIVFVYSSANIPFLELYKPLRLPD